MMAKYAKYRATEQRDYAWPMYSVQQAIEKFFDFDLVLALRFYHGDGRALDFKRAVLLFKTVYERGDAHGAYCMGYCYMVGRHVMQSERMAFDMWYKAYIDGLALFALSKCYASGWGTEPSNKLCFEFAERAAAHKIPQAHTALGYCYSKGIGRYINLNSAFWYYWMAATGGCAKGMQGLGLCYFLGSGTVRDYDKAVHWLKKAAESGYVYSIYVLAIIRGEPNSSWLDSNKAREALDRAYQFDDVNACYEIARYIHCGDIYAENTPPEQRTPDWCVQKAWPYYMRAVYKGHYLARWEVLRFLAANGVLTHQQFKQLFECCKRAIKYRQANAYFHTALCYFYGFGTDVDIIKAFYLAKKASNNRVVSALGLLGYLYLEGYNLCSKRKNNYNVGKHIPHDEYKGLALLHTATDANDPGAMLALASYYADVAYNAKSRFNSRKAAAANLGKQQTNKKSLYRQLGIKKPYYFKFEMYQQGVNLLTAFPLKYYPIYLRVDVYNAACFVDSYLQKDLNYIYAEFLTAADNALFYAACAAYSGQFYSIDAIKQRKYDNLGYQIATKIGTIQDAEKQLADAADYALNAARAYCIRKRGNKNAFLFNIYTRLEDAADHEHHRSCYELGCWYRDGFCTETYKYLTDYDKRKYYVLQFDVYTADISGNWLRNFNGACKYNAFFDVDRVKAIGLPECEQSERAICYKIQSDIAKSMEMQSDTSENLALWYFRKAALLGIAEAFVALADYEEDAKTKNRDVDGVNAFKMLLPAARAGNAVALLRCGRHYKQHAHMWFSAVRAFYMIHAAAAQRLNDAVGAFTNYHIGGANHDPFRAYRLFMRTQPGTYNEIATSLQQHIKELRETRLEMRALRDRASEGDEAAFKRWRIERNAGNEEAEEYYELDEEIWEV